MASAISEGDTAMYYSFPAQRNAERVRYLHALRSRLPSSLYPFASTLTTSGPNGARLRAPACRVSILVVISTVTTAAD
jgi:hypothetical protein